MRTLDQPYRLLSADECATLEPSVPAGGFAGGVLLETERTGNCPLFAKLVQTLDEHGVQFRFGAEVAAIRVDTGRAAVELVPPGDRRASNAREVDVISADAIVVAAGAGSLPLLDRLGWRLPAPVRVHTLTHRSRTKNTHHT